MPLGKDEIESRFGTHKATIEGAEATLPKHQTLRAQFKAFATYLDESMEDGREKDLAMKALEEASMWSHKATAKNAPLLDDALFEVDEPGPVPQETPQPEVPSFPDEQPA
jgi:hypothetical protein